MLFDADYHCLDAECFSLNDAKGLRILNDDMEVSTQNNVEQKYNPGLHQTLKLIKRSSQKMNLK